MASKRSEGAAAATSSAVRLGKTGLEQLWSRGFRLLFVADGVALASCMFAINYARFGHAWPSYPRSHYYIGFASATAIHLVIGYFVGLYAREPRIGHRPWLPRVAVAIAIGVAVEGLFFVLLDRYLMPRLNLLLLGAFGTMLLTANRLVSRLLTNRRLGPARVLLVGTDAECELAVDHLRSSERRVGVAGIINDCSDLPEAIRRNSATDVLLISTALYAEIFPEPLGTLEAQGVGVLQRVSAAQTLLGLDALRELGGMPFVPLRTKSFPAHKYNLKRLLDLVVVALGAPLIVSVGLLTALYVRWRAGSPVLYRQTRIGQAGVPFEMVKFRTMRTDAESGGAQLSRDGDDRVVRGLGWMRGTRLDELPQLLHVVTGTMSIVGPRPERPEFTKMLAAAVPGYERRFELPPGLTGLAQVHGRYSTDAEYKVGYDLQYLADWSLFLDIQIMLRTVWVVLSRRV